MENNSTIMDKIFFGIAGLCAVMLAVEKAAGLQFFYLLPETVPEIILAGALGLSLAAALMIKRHFVLGALPVFAVIGIALIGLGAADLHPQHETFRISQVKGGQVVISRDDYLGSRTYDLLAADVPVIPYLLSWHETKSVEFDSEQPELNSCITFSFPSSDQERSQFDYKIWYQSTPVFSGTKNSGKLQKLQ